MIRSNKTLDSLSIRVSALSNTAFLGRVSVSKFNPDVEVITGNKRNITHEVLNAASEIISNNNESNLPTIIEIGDIKYQLALIELKE